MKKVLLAISIAIIIGCSANPQYTSGGSKQNAHKKYNSNKKFTPTLSKAEVNEHIENAPDIDVKVGDKLYFTCSYYGKKFHGRPTSSGEIYDMNKFTAAHKKLPFGTRLKVTNEDNNKSVVVRVTDRGPFKEGRDLDLSLAAAKKINLVPYGVKKLRIEVIEVGK